MITPVIKNGSIVLEISGRDHPMDIILTLDTCRKISEKYQTLSKMIVADSNKPEKK